MILIIKKIITLITFRKDPMTDTKNESLQQEEIQQETEEEVKTKDSPFTVTEISEGDEPAAASGNLREAAYVVLFIAAVFIINAMETGSYRTPWPVAIVTAIAGFGLLGYSFMKKSPENI